MKRSRRRAGQLFLAAVLVVWPVAAGLFNRVSVKDVANAVTELDTQRAMLLLKELDEDSVDLAFQRARLAVYSGDCDSAEAILTTVPDTPESVSLAELARACARATAGSVIVEDEKNGIWVRLQDSRDEVLVPYLLEVAVKARAALSRDLGVTLPRPLRIELVRDLFSLAAVSGLPVEAAETTGTVAVARFGKVNMLTPRAARFGYPWQDTLAHELAHLALTRGSRDFAPLWLQEGIAKRQEDRWREKRPFDDTPDAHDVARRALLEGSSVGIDRLGQSIAMLPTPQAAAIAYAEVQSFMDFWIAQNGNGAFTLMLMDMRGLGTRDADAAMASATGYPLRYWIARWQQHLRGQPDPVANDANLDRDPPQAEVIKNLRVGDLLRARGHAAGASVFLDAAAKQSPGVPGATFRAAGNRLALGEFGRASELLGSLEQSTALHGGWLGLKGRTAKEAGDTTSASHLFELALAIDPLGVEAACEGISSATLVAGSSLVSPTDQKRRRLCEAARKIVRD